MKRLLLFLVLSAIGIQLPAQDNQDYRMELGGMIGTGFYNGDLNHGFYKNPGVGGGILSRWHLNPRMAVKGMLSYDAIVKGSTKAAGHFFPQDPESGATDSEGLTKKVSEAVADLTFTFEYNFWPLGLYRGYEERQRLTPFIQLGGGIAYAGKAKAVTPQLCLGVGAKYKLSERWNVGLDWSWHFTLSDKLDGMNNAYGISSSGFRNKDSYCLTMVYITYDLMAICSNCNRD